MSPENRTRDRERNRVRREATLPAHLHGTRALAMRLLPPLIVAVVFVSAPSAARERTFSVVGIPPITDERGEHDWLLSVGIDDRGRVAGTAYVWDRQQPSVLVYPVAFRFDPKTGRSTVLDPWNTGSSRALAVNRNGTILGRAWTGRGTRSRLFLFSDRGGVDRLGEGLRKWMGILSFPLLNAHDRPAGLAHRPSGRGAVVLYDPGSGWLDWSAGLRLPHRIEALALNGGGDFVVEAQHDDPSFDGIFGAFGSGPVIPVSPRGFRVSLGCLGENGQVVGTYRSPPRFVFLGPGPRRGFLFTPGEGLVEIKPPGARQVVPTWISSTGKIVGGTAKIRRMWDAVFTYSEGGGYKLTDLRQTLQEFDSALEFRTAEIVDMNDRGEFVGELSVRDRPRRCGRGSGDKLHFFLDPEIGMVDIQEVIDDARLDLGVRRVVHLNNRGQILVEVCPSDQSRTVLLLSPE